MPGYLGKVLRVDLSTGKVAEEGLDLEAVKDYIGGVGYGTHLLFEETDFSADPQGPENKVVFATGPLTATPYPTTSRYEVCTRSTQTGLWLDASTSGLWGAEFKKTGYDVLIIQGASPKPVYLLLTREGAQIRDAAHLWGQDALQVQTSLRRELGDRRLCVAAIGQAGENKVPLSCLVNDWGKTAGRGGLGAVLGAKGLKAIAVRGFQKVPVANRKALLEKVKRLKISDRPEWQTLSRWGTAATMDVGWVTGDIPVKNWRLGVWREGVIKLGGKRIAETILHGYRACLGCPIRCSRWIRIEKEGFRLEGPGPEYQTLAIFGPLLMNDDLDVVCLANDLCNRYGLDTISTGSAIAFAMEAWEKGLLSSKDADGLDLAWGKGETILALIHRIARREGYLGELLSQGVKRASAQVGKGSGEFAIHVKGLEVPMHDPRAFFAQAVNYATGSRGADHMRGNVLAEEEAVKERFSDRGKGEATKRAQDKAAIINSLILCMFAGRGLGLPEISELLELATGLPFALGELAQAGERIFNLQRLFNLRCGLKGEDDSLPRRLLTPTGEGSHAGKTPDLQIQLQEYYQARGWSPQGIPSPQKLAELGLERYIASLPA